MKIKTDIFQKLANKIYLSLTKENLITIKSSEPTIVKKILEAFLTDANKIEAINKKTNQMMEQYQSKVQSGEIDYQKMSAMIRSQLLKQEKLTPSLINYSEDHLSTLALKIHDKLYDDDDVDYSDEEASLSQIKKDLVNFFNMREEASQKAKEKIASLKRNVLPGTSEWHVLYDQYLTEELNKHGQS